VQRFSPTVTGRLGFYVYLYVDPRDDKPFYIGKGKGNRAFAHLTVDDESKKSRVLAELHALGLEPRIDLLKYGLKEKEALLVEATAIDLLQIENLTNSVRGDGSRVGSRTDVRDINAILNSKPIEIMHDVLLIKVARAYRVGMSTTDLYDVTRSAWRLGPARERIRFVLSVFDGIVREAFEVAAWVPGGSTLRANSPRQSYDVGEDRWEFVGRIAPENVRSIYLNRSVAAYFPPGSQNPVKYVSPGD
jgi:hypothetical protein